MDKPVPIKRIKNDAIVLQSDLATGAAAAIISMLIKKQGYSAKVSLNEFTMSHSDENGNVHMHVDFYLDASEKDIRKLLNMLVKEN